MGYTITAPDDVADAPTVILAHGFQGNRASMADWAAHYASWGLVVVTPDLCHATIIDPDHAQNGVDLVALADHLELAAPIYAGYSAGGLSAVLAAAQDPDALALVGLDMVDSGGLGADVAASIAIPAHDVTAEPAMCNSTANGVPVFGAIPDGATLRIVEADHCDFQSPPDAFCGLCSAPNPGFTDEQIAASIRGLTTAALLWRSGLDESGAQWWTPGAPWFDMLVEAGAMNQL
jgi:pimeloyl-ACP methyl ester carboxylesterase